MLSRILFVILLLGSAIASGQAFAQSQPKVEGSLPRDLKTGRFNLTITINNITDEMLEKGKADGEGNAALAKRFGIKLAFAESVELGTDPTAAASSAAKFYMEESQPVELDPEGITNAPGMHTLRYHIDIIEAVAGELDNQVDDTLSMKVYFYIGASEGAEPSSRNENVTIKREVYLINAQPEFDPAAPVAGSHKSLIVQWVVKDSVPTEGGDKASRTPTDVVVYVVHPDAVSTGLPAKKFSGTAGTADADASCQYTQPATDAGGACVSCDSGTYLMRSAVAKLSGFKVVSGKNADGQVKVEGLDNDLDRPYVVFMQYLPDGIGASTCLPGKPSPNFTLTELNGEGDAEVVDFRCFIATAAYGTPMHADIKYFRKFRNDVLLTNPVGRAFVAAYYRFSPPIAAYIAEHPALRDFVRGFLEVPAGMLRTFDEYY